MNNNELIKAIDKIEGINKDRLYKEEFLKEETQESHEGFDKMLNEEIEKLRHEKERKTISKNYLNIVKALYEKENRKLR